MKKAISTLNASTRDILNTIHANATGGYRKKIPSVETYTDIPKVGEYICGYPAFANEFIEALIGRIAFVAIKTALYKSNMRELSQGKMPYGKTIEEVFVEIANVREFNTNKAGEREFKNTPPKVKTAFHSINWRAQYPISITIEELRTAFLSENGVQDMISRVFDSIYTAAEYDDYLLHKYVLIKAIAHGHVGTYPVDTSDIKNAAVAFRGTSNNFLQMKNSYNDAGVLTTTPREKQYIFMDSYYNASYDVDVLASSFNMGKADFMGRLVLIDDWSSFDNARFAEIRQNSDGIEEVTAEELEIVSKVKAVLVDRDFFQFYDVLNGMTNTYVNSGLRWNYNYNDWRVISVSPFHNIVAFVDSTADTELPGTLTFTVTDKSNDKKSNILSFGMSDAVSLVAGDASLIQTDECTRAMVAVHKWGAVILPVSTAGVTLTAVVDGVIYNSSAKVTGAESVGDTITMTKVTDSSGALTGLTITNGTLDPSFSGSVYNYTMTSSAATSTVTVTGGNAVNITVNNIGIANGGTATWNNGENTVTITSISYANGKASVLTYKVIVTYTA